MNVTIEIAFPFHFRRPKPKNVHRRRWSYCSMGVGGICWPSSFTPRGVMSIYFEWSIKEVFASLPLTNELSKLITILWPTQFLKPFKAPEDRFLRESLLNMNMTNLADAGGVSQICVIIVSFFSLASCFYFCYGSTPDLLISLTNGLNSLRIRELNNRDLRRTEGVRDQV